VPFIGGIFIQERFWPKHSKVRFWAQFSTLGGDVSEVERKFCACCNSVLCQSKYEYAWDVVKVMLIRSYCLPLLTYIALVHCAVITTEAIRQLAMYWNDAFRKIFKYSRMESVKLLQYFFSCLHITTMIHVSRNFCHHVLLFVNISGVCFVFRISSMVILLTFKIIMIHYVQKLRTVVLHPLFIVTLLQLYLGACDRFKCLTV